MIAASVPFSSIRALPVPVRPVDGEIPESFFLRLATANAISDQSLWSHIRALHGSLPDKRSPQLASAQLEALGGLPEGWFQTNRRRHLLPIRCTHTQWKLQLCDQCSRTPPTRPACPRCAAGQAVQVATSAGAVCLRHRRWVHQGADIDVSALTAHLAAERRFRACLKDRGVALETGELQLAATLLRDSADIQPDQASSAEDGAPSLLKLYPDAVRLAIELTDPRFTALLLDPYWSPNAQALILSRAVAEVTRTSHDTPGPGIWDTVYTGRRAITAAFGIQGLHRHCPQQRALCAAAYTHRACLLRHLDAKLTRPRGIKIPALRLPAAAVVVRYQHPWTA